MLSRHYLKIDVWSLRSALAWILLITAVLMIPVSVIFFWLRFSIYNTDQFVKTLSPISKNVYIVESLSNDLSNNFFQNIDAEKKIKEALPDKAKFLAPALTFQLKKFIAEEGKVLLTSDAFNNLWEKALRNVHPVIIKIMTGQGDISINKQGEVVLDFTDAVDKLKANLNGKGITLFNNILVNPQVTLFQSEKLASLQNIFSFISVLGIALPTIVILFMISAVLFSLKRLQFLFWVGIGILASSALLFFLIQIGEGYFAKEGGAIDVKAAEALYEILTAAIKKISIEISIFGAAIALMAKYLPHNSFFKKYLTK